MQSSSDNPTNNPVDKKWNTINNKDYYNRNKAKRFLSKNDEKDLEFIINKNDEFKVLLNSLGFDKFDSFMTEHEGETVYFISFCGIFGNTRIFFGWCWIYEMEELVMVADMSTNVILTDIVDPQLNSEINNIKMIHMTYDILAKYVDRLIDANNTQKNIPSVNLERKN